MSIKQKLDYFTTWEKALWLTSVITITAFYLIFDSGSPLSLIASLIGATSLIFCAKGNPAGHVLIIIFALLYGYISFTFRYYGEMFTYVGMSAPMSALALVSWLKNPYKGKKSEVTISSVTKKDLLLMVVLASAVTFAFYFILKYLGTANLIPSTISVATSFSAVFLTYKRSPYFPLFYAANDIVLIVLWTLASIKDPSYISVTVCFFVFLVNDLYSFTNWLRMRKKQRENA